ncbi:type IV secretion system protein VirD4 [Lactobacillus bombicola]|uniref:Type IV secretion system protein VirD4 n=1 Tax=Lactobacillus bombicola TaxID=1505723 RepID=A0A1I1TUC2_9LACO|nr:type IV secretory system conjugative DNA transfer family protein [Lactobacillus bombicola]SFD62197.1 type IV secretion system protein VirD4 [Lactobacillus bombicola]
MIFQIGIMVGWQDMRTKVTNKTSSKTTKHKIGLFIKKIWFDLEKQLHKPKDDKKVNSSKQTTKIKIIVAILIGLLVFILLIWVFGTAHSIMLQTSKKGYSFIDNGIDFDKAARYAMNFRNLSITSDEMFALVMASGIIGGFLSNKFNYATRKVAYGQKGNSRFTIIKELEDTYVRVPDHLQAQKQENEASFKGYGGFPVAHINKGFFLAKKGYYYLDTSTTHNLIIGTSRSGKGETTIIEMIDLLSRAEKKSSLVINDPKGELYVAGATTLRKRGYDVYLLNLEDGNKGMAFNPLSLIVKNWVQGNIEEAMQLINSLTFMLYNDPKAGQNKWVNDSAQSAVNAMIIALIEFCLNPNNFDDHIPHPEKITLNNIADMLQQLGTVDYAKNPANPYNLSDLLSEYFKHLDQNSIAKKAFGSTSFSDDRGKGSIYSTIDQKLNIFTLKKNAKMTSENTIDLKSIGFPKYLSFKLINPDLEGKIVKLVFKSRRGSIKSTYEMRVNIGGFVEYNFDVKLNNGDYLIISTADNKAQSMFKLKFSKTSKEVEVLPFKKKELSIKQIQMHYSDKPTAVFMKIPDYNPANNVLASIFVNQLYTELARQCSFVAGHKTITRVQMILDEFSNMTPLKNMDSIMTVSAGRNILFTLAIQSLSQLSSKYGNSDSQVIKENCQNLCLIKSTDYKTNKEFAEACGTKTIESSNVSKSLMNTTQNVNVSAEAVPLITTDRVKDLGMGERLILRPLIRQNKYGFKTQAHPIFNTGKTVMPYAHTFLKDEFDVNGNPDLVEELQPHAYLDLDKLSIDWTKLLTWTDRVVYEGGIVQYEHLALNAYENYLNKKHNEQEYEESEENGENSNAQKISIIHKFIKKYHDQLNAEIIGKLEELANDSTSAVTDFIQVIYSNLDEELGQEIGRKFIKIYNELDSKNSENDIENKLKELCD